MKTLGIALLTLLITSPLYADEKNTEIQNHDLIMNVQRDLGLLSAAIDLFKTDTGMYPSQEKGLQSLIRNPGINNWEGPYISVKDGNIPKDPWGTEYRYRMINEKYIVDSAGPDMKFGTEDDILP